MGEQISYKTNELENAIDYLEQVVKFYKDRLNPHRFKWLMITLHGALYGFAVCAIKGSRSYANVIKDNINVNSPKYKKKKAELQEIFSNYNFDYCDFDIMTELNISELLPIWGVLNRCKSKEYMMQFDNSKILEINPLQEHAIKKLVEYRNHLVHFKPSFYGIVGDYEQDIVHPVVDIIGFLALQSNNVMYYNDESKMRVEKAIQIMKSVS